MPVPMKTMTKNRTIKTTSSLMKLVPLVNNQKRYVNFYREEDPHTKTRQSGTVWFILKEGNYVFFSGIFSRSPLDSSGPISLIRKITTLNIRLAKTFLIGLILVP